MQPRDWFSLAALVISIATAYFSFLRGAKLQHQLGDVILVRVSLDNKLIFMPELALFNTGARVGVITKITGELISLVDNTKTHLTWAANMITEYKAPASPGEPSGAFTRFDSFPHTLFVSKSDAVIKRLLLTADRPYELASGDFDVTIRVHTTSKVDHVLTLRRTLRFRNQDIQFIQNNRGKREGQNLRLNFDPELNVYLSALPPVVQASSVAMQSASSQPGA